MYKYSKSLNTTVSNSQAQDVEEKKRNLNLILKKYIEAEQGRVRATINSNKMIIQL